MFLSGLLPAFQRLLPGLFGVVLAGVVVSPVPGQWYTGQGDSGRRHTEAFGPGARPPLTAWRHYIAGDVEGAVTDLLLDRQRLYLIGYWQVEAMERVETAGGLPSTERDTIIWSYEIDRSVPGRRIGSARSHPSNVGAVLAGGMLVLPIETPVQFIGGTTELTGLDPMTGEEVWQYDLGRAIGPVILPVQNDIVVRWSDLSDFSWPLSDGPAEFSEFAKIDRLMRITPGQETPQTLRPIHAPQDYGDMVLAGSNIVLIEMFGVTAYHSETLEPLWRYPENANPRAPVEYEEIQYMAAHGSDVYLAQEGTRIFSLDGAGNLRWEQVLEPDESCRSRMTLATDGRSLVVSGVCGDRIYGLDTRTGAVLWQVTRPADATPIVLTTPVLTDGTVYHAFYYADWPVVSTIQGIDAMSGEILQELTMTDHWGFWLAPMAAGGGFLYAGSVHMFHDHDGRIVAYETEPADFGVRFQAPDRYACGAYVGVESPITLQVESQGPGTVFDARLRIRAAGPRLIWTPPEGYDVRWEGDFMIVELGDLGPGYSQTLDLAFLPLTEGHTVLQVLMESAVRSLDPRAQRDVMRFDVVDRAPPGVELTIDWVEATQGIQDGENSIALIAGKTTLLRAYARSNVPVDGVRAEMYLSGSVSSRPFSEIVTPLENCLTLTPEGPDREDISTTFNFLIPPELQDGVPDGPFNVQILLDPEGALSHTKSMDSIYTMQLHFDVVPPICLYNHSVRHRANVSGGEVTPDDVIPWGMIFRAQSLLPTPEILQFRSGNTLEKTGFFRWQPYELDPGGSMNTTGMLSSLWTHSKTTRRPPACREHGASVHHVGIVAESNLTTHPDGNQFNGIGYRPGRSLAFRLREGTTPTISVPRAGVTLAHELGHNYNRRHVDCGDPPGIDRNYPHDPCQIGPVEDDAFFGMDLKRRHAPGVIPPRPADATHQLGDLMSYAGRRWTSDYTWNAIRDRLTSKKAMAEERAEKAGPTFSSDEKARAWLNQWKGPEEKYILVIAVIEEGIPTTIENVMPVSHSVVPKETALDLVTKQFAAGENGSSYAFEVLDTAGVVILTVAAEPQEIEDNEVPARTVGALVPMPDGVGSIRLVEDGTPVASRERSQSVPEVELIEPAAGTVVTDVLVVDWEATDPDGDDLTTMIQYSDDDGESWITLTTNALESPFVREADFLPGALGTARIRIIVNDGFNATEAVSGAFTVEPKPPLVEILQPGEGETFAIGEPILLHAEAYDPEDGPLRGSAFLWEINGIGAIGTGRERILRDLMPGTHTLSVTATDSLGLTSAAEVTIFVEARSATRTEIAARLLGILGEEPEVEYDLNTDGAVDSADIPHAEGRR